MCGKNESYQGSKAFVGGAFGGFQEYMFLLGLVVEGAEVRIAARSFDQDAGINPKPVGVGGCKVLKDDRVESSS